MVAASALACCVLASWRFHRTQQLFLSFVIGVRRPLTTLSRLRIGSSALRGKRALRLSAQLLRSVLGVLSAVDSQALGRGLSYGTGLLLAA